mmetsp:Transcript_39852/g.61041  ORF Transcript_39852/g.61041 Transcript_39852/m.61041 type:complete len:125 (+) Transcript_39852:1552-1926(+)
MAQRCFHFGWRDNTLDASELNSRNRSMRKRSTSASHRSHSPLVIKLAASKSARRPLVLELARLAFLYVEVVGCGIILAHSELELERRIIIILLQVREAAVQIDIPCYILHNSLVLLLDNAGLIS